MTEYRWETTAGVFDMRNLIFILTDSLYVSLGDIASDLVEGETPDSINASCMTFIHDRQCFILMDRSWGVTHRAVYHESLHAAVCILKDHGVLISPDNDEVIAYYQDWIAGTIFDWLKKAKIRISPFSYHENRPPGKLKIRKL